MFYFTMPDADVVVDITVKPANYLTLTSLSGTSKVKLQNYGNNNPNISFTRDNGMTWLEMPTTGVTIAEGESIMLRGNNPNGFSSSLTNRSSIVITGNASVSGSVMSLIDNKGETTDIPNAFCFAGLFSGSVGLTKVDKGLLPATTLQISCYYSMFNDCTNLTIVDSDFLPATTLQPSCYSSMFSGCTNLTETPKLPALQMEELCYSGMFYGCNKLKKAPELPATSLQISCYSYMFAGCSSLTEAPKLPALQMEEQCYSKMFKNCIALKTAPELPAATIVNKCYQEMFSGCRSLNAVSVGFTSWGSNQDTYQWLKDVATSGTFESAYGLELLTGENYIPNNWVIAGSSIVKFAPAVAENGYVTKIANKAYAKGESVSFTLTDKAEDANVFVSVNGNEMLEVTRSGNTFTFVMPASDVTVNVTKCLTFVALEDAEMKLYFNSYYDVTQNAEYSLDNGMTWFECNSQNKDIEKGHFIMYRGNNPTGFSTDEDNCGTFVVEGQMDVYGNVMSLIDQKGDTKVVPNINCFISLFKECYDIRNVDANLLPATKLTQGCYSSMFTGCSNLRNAPYLPATALASSCYSNMFNGCTALQNAPELAATTLASNCYSYMFSGCRALQTAPYLPATALVNGCYSNMFNGCSNLNSIKVEFSSWGSGNTNNWVKGVASEGTFECPKDLKLTRGVSNIPNNWKVMGMPTVKFAPGVAENGYVTNTEDSQPPVGQTLTIKLTDKAKDANVFVSVNGNEMLEVTRSGNTCTFVMPASDVTVNVTKCLTFVAKVDSRFEVKRFGTSIANVEYSLDNGLTWSDNVESTVNVAGNHFVLFRGDNPNGFSTSASDFTNLIFAVNGNLYGNVMSLLDKKGDLKVIPNDYCFFQLLIRSSGISGVDENLLPATTLKPHCYEAMFNSCVGIRNVPELPATKLEKSCYAGMFISCLNITKAPELPATELAESCYSQMFNNCSSLSAAPYLPAENLVNKCYNQMFYNCKNLNFVKVNFKQWHSNATYLWLSGVASVGTFTCPVELANEIATSRVPQNWSRPYMVTISDASLAKGYVNLNEKINYNGEEVSLAVKEVYSGWNAVVNVINGTDTTSANEDEGVYTFTMPANNVTLDVKYYWHGDADHTAPFDFTDNTITYTRKTKNWGTLCLPYSFKASDGNVQLFRVESIDDDVLNIVQITSVEAGEPVLFYNSNPANMLTITCAGNDATSYAGTNGVVAGTFSKFVVGRDDNTVAENSYYLKDNKFYQGNDHFVVRPFCAYITMPNNTNHSFRINLNDVVEDAVSATETKDAEVEAIYNFKGQRVGRMESGKSYILKMDDGTSRKVVVK